MNEFRDVRLLVAPDVRPELPPDRTFQDINRTFPDISGHEPDICGHQQDIAPIQQHTKRSFS